MKFLFFAILLIASPIVINLDINLQRADSRCSNGTHKSPSGDCEKVTQDKGKPGVQTATIESLTVIAKRQEAIMTVLKIHQITKQIKKAITTTDTIKITTLLAMKKMVQDQSTQIPPFW